MVLYNFKDLTGQRFGRLLVIEYSSKNKWGNATWLCRCDCGNEKIICSNSLKRGLTKSCGCICKDFPRSKTHGESATRFYRIWVKIKLRCLNPNMQDFKYWGGRGINVCDRWLKFENFRDDMYESYLAHVEEFGEKQTSIDRINNDGNYETSNCRWATNLVQAHNKRIYPTQKEFKAISPNGEEFIFNNQRAFAKEHNLCRGRIQDCLKNKISQYKEWRLEYV